MQTRERISKSISYEDVIAFSFLSAVPLWTYVFLPLLYLPNNSTSQEGHAMSAGNWTDIVTAVSGGAAAFFTAVAAVAAVVAASTWWKGLKNERIDNALSAVHDLDARIDRVVAIRGGNNTDQLWRAYNEAWDSRSRFNQAYVVAQRYDDGLRKFNAPNEFTALLNELRTIAERGKAVNDKVADEFKARVDAVVRTTADRLRPP